MSTGADCGFYVKNNQWFYDIQAWPYGETEDYETFGPFAHFGDARKHLDRNHANPGGWWTETDEVMVRGCSHERRDVNDDCYHCGKYLKEG